MARTEKGNKYGNHMTIKLNLFFIAMDILALMAYPIVFIDGKMRHLSKMQPVTASSDTVRIVSEKHPIDPL
jgi:hypothetical protein